MRFLPKIRIEKYPLNNPKKPEPGWAPVVAVGFTGRGNEFDQGQGIGIGIALGLIDVWFGWPKKRESLHYKGCVHDPAVIAAKAASS